MLRIIRKVCVECGLVRGALTGASCPRCASGAAVAVRDER